MDDTPPPPLPRSAGMDRLRAIMARLRDPETGCPWDIEQDFASIAPYTIEEAYEVADAIETRGLGELKGELGDLLLQSVYHTQMAEEAGISPSTTWSPPSPTRWSPAIPMSSATKAGTNPPSSRRATGKR
jgi:NTP pyrophosphatase (non-canonical NTP hydrolase)